MYFKSFSLNFKHISISYLQVLFTLKTSEGKSGDTSAILII
nr:MAG TPA: hypothetical protein [Caudoviricetes sp.]